MKSFLIAAICAVVTAVPQGSTPGSSPACPFGRSPYCCDIRATPQTPSTGCDFPARLPADGYIFFSDCSNISKQAACCTRVTAAGAGRDCQVYVP
ncbi:hypothetical protein CERZMDRAFT_97453 [Cercospora zeae-maydis SCOH1-5]|uniref:Hydrophobin n=1 Tax=Cercospora zeae-maydis SCOH1-5 TaxID=717836 RepID=A0A6A6FG03_9PEZI|nr:hypothetical protein CERZMDRAFT_97453 [Cercospora zeae-maydis SCOH1-5]